MVIKHHYNYHHDCIISIGYISSKLNPGSATRFLEHINSFPKAFLDGPFIDEVSA